MVRAILFITLMWSLLSSFSSAQKLPFVETETGEKLPYLVVKEPSKPKENLPLLIGLHGFGSNQDQIESLVNPELDFECYYLAPQGFLSHKEFDGLAKNEFAWFSLEIKDGQPVFNEEDVFACIRKLESFIELAEKKYNTDPKKVILIGYSQGGAVACSASLMMKKLRGVAAFAGALYAEPKEISENPKHFFLSYGKMDSFVSEEEIHHTKEVAEAHGKKVELHEYNIPHVVSEGGREDLAKWIVNVLERK